MTLPTTGFAIAALIVLALPGIVFAAVRRWLRGERHEDRDFGLALARGLVFSVTLTALYLVIAGSLSPLGIEVGAKNLVIGDWRRVGAAVAILFVLVPLGLSLAWHRRDIAWVQPLPKRRWTRWVRRPRPRAGYSAIPAAWDFAVRLKQPSFVRIRKANGLWVGGWFTKGSFATTYPEPRSIYIGEQHQVDEQGTIGAGIPNTGVWVMIEDGDIVTWESPSPATSANAPAPAPDKGAPS